MDEIDPTTNTHHFFVNMIGGWNLARWNQIQSSSLR